MTLTEWINPRYLEEAWIKQANADYNGETPYPHMQIEDWLREEKLEEVEDALQEFDFIHKESDLFSLAQTADLTTASDPVIRSFVQFLDSDELRQWFAKITRVQTTPGKLDLFGAIYQDTDYLLAHDDQLEDRKIALIVYLTTLDMDEQGGALALFTDDDGHPGTLKKRYPAQRNAISFFTVSEKSWHEVEEITDTVYRVSIGGWLRG